MIKFVVAKNDDAIFNSYILPSLQQIKAQLIQVTDDDSAKKKDSIFTKYNVGIHGVIQSSGLTEDDIVVFVHEDVKFLDRHYAEKMELIFKEKPEVGVVGVAGTSELTETGGWWQSPQDKLRGHIYQEKNNGVVDHMVWNTFGYYDDLVTVDGCMFGVRGKVLMDGVKFDNQTYTGYDFYDVDFCLSVLEKGYKIAIADILIQHKSMGMGSTKDGWKQSREVMLKKWKSKGYKFPLDNTQFKTDENKDSGIIEIDI